MSGQQKFRYAVSKGDYSDYRVLCVCDSEKRAKRVVDLYNASDASSWDQARVEALPYVDSDPEQIRVYSVQENVWDDGTTSEYRESTRVEWPFDALYPESLIQSSWRWVRAPMHKGKGGRLEVRGTDEKRVRRVFSDKRAQLKADDAFRLRRDATARSRNLPADPS